MTLGVAKATTNPINDIKKAKEGVDLSCFNGSDHLIMKHVDGAAIASLF